MAKMLSQVKIDPSFLENEDLTFLDDGDGKGNRVMAAAINDIFNQFDLPGKNYTLMAGVDSEDASKLLVAIVDKDWVEDIYCDNKDSLIINKKYFKNNAQALVSFDIKEKWDDEVIEHEYLLPVRHAQQLDPEYGIDPEYVYSMSITVSKAVTLVQPKLGLENVVDALKQIENTRFDVGSHSSEESYPSRRDLKPFTLDVEGLSKKIADLFGKAAYGTSNRLKCQADAPGLS